MSMENPAGQKGIDKTLYKCSTCYEVSGKGCQREGQENLPAEDSPDYVGEGRSYDFTDMKLLATVSTERPP